MSWAALEPLVRTAAPEVREAVRLVSEAQNSRTRHRALRKLSKILGSAANPLVLQLARHPSSAARRLALDLTARLRHRAAVVRRAVLNLVSDRSIPVATRLRATRMMLRDLRDDPKRSMQVLRRFVAGLGRGKAIERLNRVAPRLRTSDALLNSLRSDLANRQRLSCPRCGVMRRRRRMIDHLWKRHRLILEGRRALTIWQAIDERIKIMDPATALNDFHRTMLRRGQWDEEALKHLQNEAALRHETICPQCYSATPMPEPPMEKPLEVSRGRIAGDGYAITIDDRSLRSYVRVDSRNGITTESREPNSAFSAQALAQISVLVAVIAFAAAAFAPSPGHLLCVVLLLSAVVALQTVGRRGAQRVSHPTDRAVNHAWARLAPIWRTSTILDRLALASISRGDPEHRKEEIAEAIVARTTDTSSADDSRSSLSALWWLQAADRGENGNDPVHELAIRIDECLAGRAPIACGAGLLELALTNLRPRSDRARLRVQICAAAFAHGFSVADLAELGRAFPSFAQLLNTDDVDSLACLRFVWDQRDEQPWRECGPAISVFEMARYPDAFGPSVWSIPDLLIYLPLPAPGPDSPALPLTLSSHGVVIGEATLREVPEHVWAWQRPEWQGGGFELRFDPHRISYADDPSSLVERLRRWLAFGLKEFLPRVGSIPRYRKTGKAEELLRSRRIVCPSCTGLMIPVVGRVGLAAEPEYAN